MLKRNYPRFFKNYIFKGIVLAGVLVIVYTASVQSRMKYYPHQPYVQKALFISQDMKTRWVMWVDYCSKFYQPLETITPYLRDLGIKRNDLIYCTPDVTINAWLYLMDQNGFTDFYFGSLPEDERLRALQNQQVEYLVLLVTTYHQNPKFAPFIKKKISTYKTVEVWDLR